MKNVIVLLFAFVLITSCGGQKKQANEDVQNVQLKRFPLIQLFFVMHTELGCKEIKR